MYYTRSSIAVPCETLEVLRCRKLQIIIVQCRWEFWEVAGISEVECLGLVEDEVADIEVEVECAIVIFSRVVHPIRYYDCVHRVIRIDGHRDNLGVLRHRLIYCHVHDLERLYRVALHNIGNGLTAVDIGATVLIGARFDAPRKPVPSLCLVEALGTRWQVCVFHSRFN